MTALSGRRRRIHNAPQARDRLAAADDARAIGLDRAQERAHVIEILRQSCDAGDGRSHGARSKDEADGSGCGISESRLRDSKVIETLDLSIGAAHKLERSLH